jgi:hypothetical protein
MTMTTLQEAIKVGDEYLSKHPNMVKFQQQIDETLDKCRDEDRFAVIALMLSGKMFELQNKLFELQTIVDKEKEDEQTKE